MRQVLDLCDGPLDGPLLPARTAPRILALADQLPPLSGAGLEVHLNAPRPRTDLLIRATVPDGGRAAFAGRHPLFKVGRSLRAGAPWRAIGVFFEAWSDPSSPLFAQVENVWLEFDVPPQAALPLQPSILFDIDRDDRRPIAAKMAALESALAALGCPPSTAIVGHVARCLARARPHVHLYYAGVMLGRGSDAVRLCLRGQDLDGAIDALRSMGWPGSGPALEAALAPLAGHTHQVILDLDIDRTLARGVGVELFCARWTPFLDRLIARQLCTPAEAAALLDWPGYEAIRDGDLQAFLSAALGRDVRRSIRRLNHVKLTYAPDGQISAKAYLYLAYH
jgi:hypothetical protein